MAATAITSTPATAAPVSSGDTASGTNSNVTITLTPEAGCRWQLYEVSFSYDDTPDGGVDVYTWDGASATLVRSWDQVQAGPAPLPFHVPLLSPVGQSFRVTLRAGGSGVVGKLNVSAAKVGV